MQPAASPNTVSAFLKAYGVTLDGLRHSHASRLMPNIQEGAAERLTMRCTRP